MIWDALKAPMTWAQILRDGGAQRSVRINLPKSGSFLEEGAHELDLEKWITGKSEGTSLGLILLCKQYTGG